MAEHSTTSTTTAAATTTSSRWRRMGRAVAYGLGFAVPVTGLAFLVREKFQPVIDLDQRAIVAATDLTRSHSLVDDFFVVWQEATQPKWLYIVATGLCLWVWRRHGLKSRAIWAFVTMMIAWNLQLVLKQIVQRARPVVSDPVSHAPGYSFPSGHVANIAAIATAVLILTWPLLSARGRRVAVTVAVTAVVVTMLDRVFLGVHFPSDVVAGVLFGGGLVTASYLGYLGWNPAQPDDAPPPEGRSGPEPESTKGLS
ncbi:MAG: phosphatase PAP2 family protein [Terracoccus sp.]